MRQGENFPGMDFHVRSVHSILQMTNTLETFWYLGTEMK